MPQWKKIPINQPVYTNVDPVSLSGRTPERHDTYRNDAGATVRRPGFDLFADLGTSAPVDGIYYWESQDLLIAVSNGDVFSKTETGSVSTLATGVFVAGTRPTFADFGDTLYAANGGDIVKITTSTASALGDADIPANVTHVAAFDTYMLANKVDTGQMHRSNVNAPETWDANFITAEQAPDNLTAVHARWNEIWLFGTRTVERWYNDGETPFVPFDGGVLSTGCEAPYSIQWIRGAFYWLNEERELVRSAGNSYEILSGPVENLLRDTRTISDAIADYMTVGGETFYVLSLPSYSSDGLTLVYDITKNEWQGEWNYWDSVASSYERFRGQCYVFATSWNRHLLGDKDNGKIYYMRTDKHQDNGDIMRSAWLTGHVDHDSSLKKRSAKLRLRVQRGEGAEGSTPKLMLRWRDNGNEVWKNIHYLDLGELGEYEMYLTLRRLGIYRSRQYELFVTDDVPIVLAEAEELVEVIPQ
jgi:hypothetical protein